MQVVHIDLQHGDKVPELPDTDVNYHSDIAGGERPWRTDLKPLDIVQPEGPSFSVSIANSAGVGRQQSTVWCAAVHITGSVRACMMADILVQCGETLQTIRRKVECQRLAHMNTQVPTL